MPIYEYLCSTCHRTCELRRNMTDADQGVTCPACGADEAHRMLSSFVAFSGKGPQLRVVASSSPCAGCTPVGGCVCRGSK